MWIPRHGILQSGRSVAVTPPLDIYTGAAAAYSLRKLRSAYTGNAIRVQRTDGGQIDIGFDGSGNLNQSALLSFIGSSGATVIKWYDQSGNGINADNISNAPRIVSAGVIDKLNNKPALFYTGGGLKTAASFDIATNKILDVFFVANSSTTSSGIYLSVKRTSLEDYSSGAAIYTVRSANYNESIMGLGSGGTAASSYNYQYFSESPTSQELRYTQFSTAGMTVFKNSVSKTLLAGGGSMALSNWLSSGSGNHALWLGCRGGATSDTTVSQGHSGYIQEMIFYSTSQSSNRAGIESNINQFYTIY